LGHHPTEARALSRSLRPFRRAENRALRRQESPQHFSLTLAFIRNRLKIASTISNAQALLKVQQEFGSFASYLWQFVGGKPIENVWKLHKQVPAKTKNPTP